MTNIRNSPLLVKFKVFRVCGFTKNCLETSHSCMKCEETSRCDCTVAPKGHMGSGPAQCKAFFDRSFVVGTSESPRDEFSLSCRTGL